VLFLYILFCLPAAASGGCLAGVVSAAAASWHVLLAGWLAGSGSLGFWGACGPGRGLGFGVGMAMGMGLLRLRLRLGLGLKHGLLAGWLAGSWLMAFGPDGGWLQPVAVANSRWGRGMARGRWGRAVCVRQRWRRVNGSRLAAKAKATTTPRQQQRRFALCSAEFSISVVS